VKGSTTNRLRHKANALLRELKASVWIVSPPDPGEISRLARYIEAIEVANKRQLYSIIKQIEDKISEFRATYKIRAPSSVLLDILQMMENAPQGKSLLMPLHVWRGLFKGDAYPFAGMDVWPLHARITLDASGLVYAESRHPEVQLLEAIMFEDMAALFNLAKMESLSISTEVQNKLQIKRRNALCRATIMAAIYFIESYLNGLAVDYVISNEPDLELSTKSVLLDWDYDRNRPRYLSLRDKLLQYQRILLKTKHAPLQETNCSEMATIVNTAKLVRDAVAHPSPSLDPKTIDPDKERAILGLGIETTLETVDAAVSLVLQIEETVRGDRKRLFWLQKRDSSGLFPDTAFQ
jgi:hypothetical protein